MKTLIGLTLIRIKIGLTHLQFVREKFAGIRLKDLIAEQVRETLFILIGPLILMHHLIKLLSVTILNLGYP